MDSLDRERAKKQNWLVMVLIVVVSIVFYMVIVPKNYFDINPYDVRSLVLVSGETGATIEVTDRWDIEHICNDLRNVNLRITGVSSAISGECYEVNVEYYDGRGGDIKSLVVVDSETIHYNNKRYAANAGQIDFRYLQMIFWASEPSFN